MKVTEIISENRRTAIQRFTGLFMGLSRNQVVEKIAQQWARDIEQAAARGVPARLSSVTRILPERFRGDKSILQDARNMANRMVAQKVGATMFKGWNEIAAWATRAGLGYSFYNLVVGLYEDAGQFQGQEFQQAAQTRVDRFVAEAAAILTVAGAGYILKLPTGLQAWFGWVPGVRALTNGLATLGPTAVAALNAWIATPDGRKAIAEFFTYNTLLSSTAQTVRAWAGGLVKEKMQPLIDKIQDLQDPEGAQGRQGERDQRAAAIQARDANTQIKSPLENPNNKMLSRSDLGMR